MSVVAVATVFPPASRMLSVAPATPIPLELTTEPITGSAIVLTRRLSIRPCTSFKSTVTGLKVTPAMAHDVAMCLLLCAKS